jgi:6-pyruvoyl-tetrahydropterin synthase
MKIRKTVTFEAAHTLPFHKNVHGHSYSVTIELDGVLDKSHNEISGVIMPFGTIERTIKDNLDHKNLNKIIDKPTMENVALYIGRLFPGAKIILCRPSCGEEVEL